MSNIIKIEELFKKITEKFEDYYSQTKDENLIMHLSKFSLRHGDEYAKLAVYFKKMCDEAGEEMPKDQMWQDGKYYQGTVEEKIAFENWRKLLGELNELISLLKLELKL